MLIDSHCHLTDIKLKSHLEDVLTAAKSAGVEKFINIGTNLNDSMKGVALAEKNKAVYTTVGIYPHEEREKNINATINDLEEIVKTGRVKVVGIGECGIDLFEHAGFENRDITSQIKLFVSQIELAVYYKLPVVIHNRNADSQIIEALENYKGKITGVAHCFVSSWETAKAFLDLGFFISFSAIITYPSGKAILETVRNVPEDRFVLETDAPFLPPQGFRNQINEPKYVKIVAQKVAEVKGLPFELVCHNAYVNTQTLFNL